MNDSLDLSYYENALDVTKIDSHTSQLTNLRLHNLESQVDAWRMKVRQDATQDNIIGYYSSLNAMMSYISSIAKEGSNLAKEVKRIQEQVKELSEYWSFMRKGIMTAKIKAIKNKFPKTFWKIIENSMIQKCDDVTDALRKAYQSLSFYFRTSQTPEVTGILGDIVAITRRKKKEKGDNDELERTNEQSNGNS
jgi:hypothetical protein